MRKLLRRSLLILAVYGGAVLLMLALATFARGFSLGVGDAQIAGRYAVFPLLRSHTLTALTLTWNGITLRFSRSTTPALEGIETSDAGTDIVFAGGARLRLTSGSDSGSLSIAPVGSPGGSARAALVIPYTVAGAAGEPIGGTALWWKRGGRAYGLSLPARARVDRATRLLMLPLGDAAGAMSLRMASSSTATTSALPTRAKPLRAVSAPTRLPNEKSLATSEQLQAALARFADAAYAGWSQTRLSAATGQWKMPDATLVFSEDIGVGLLAESIARGTWQGLLTVWSEALRLQQGGAQGSGPEPPVTSTYTGSVREYIRAIQPRAAAEVERVRALLQKSDPAVLKRAGLIALLLDHGGGDLISSALAFMTGRIASGLDIAASLGLLEGLLDYAENMGPSDAVTRLTRETIDRSIIPSIRSTDAGLFLSIGGAAADVGTGLRCGSLLLRAGARLDYSLASAIGRGLLTAGLSLAGDGGFLPSRLTLSSGRISAREGTLAPESVYALLPLDRRMPKEISLSRKWSPGSWMWTSAQLVSAQGTSAESRLVLAYPVGVPHYLAIQGVAPFAQIRLHGIAWRTDPGYAKYSDGWAYDSGSRTLFLKLTGRAEQEEIDIRY